MISGRNSAFRPSPANLLLRRARTTIPFIYRVSRFVTTASTSRDVKPYYITTPIFYPNAVPHIGHLYSLVTADIFARFSRLTDPSRPVVFLAGTDEHGLKIQKAAQDQGVEPRQLCDRLSHQFRNLVTRANISCTTFQRTTEDTHRKAVEHVWRQLDAKGLIYKSTYAGWYSISDECFYPSTQITTLPSGATVSTETGSPVEWSEEENYKFRLSHFREALLEQYQPPSPSLSHEPEPHGEPHPAARIFPPAHHARVLADLSDLPLDDLSISRPRSRLAWGIPVPGDPSHTIYVWFDALTVYLTGVGYPWTTTGQAGAWPPDVQVIGKDIVRFHALYLPALLLALDLPLARTLLAHAHWTVAQRKMSKSIGNVADPFDAMNVFGVDVVRYYLARVGGRFRDDVDWSHEQLEKHSDEIRSLLGNYFLRITSRAILERIAQAPSMSVPEYIASAFPRHLSGSVQDVSNSSVSGDTNADPNTALLASLQHLGARVQRLITAHEVGEALDEIMLCLKQANAALTHTAPWAPSQPPATAQAAYLTALETLRVCGTCLQPFVPATAERLLDALGVPAGKRTMNFVGLGAVEFAGLGSGEGETRLQRVKLFEVPRKVEV